ncbi:autotransporter outer membrane beta-barrel domain-containing protein [Novosphingobium sp.]|uniref:autotransporter outer membrane beta-barrel domain-containing protein n=1 Tax=Novosphingobium sp. TaxID=1874826 RepID=UPI002FDEF6C5
MQRHSRTRYLSSAAIIALPVALVAGAAPALADTSVSTSTTTPLTTSSAGNVTVTGTGAIKVNSGTAVTVNSSSNVAVNSSGSITLLGADNSAGIVANGGVTTTLTNDGTISVTEDFTPTTLGNSNVVSGSVASANNRFGIHVLSGAATAATIKNTGTIVVEGNNSGGIVVDSDLNGSITNTGTISVKGNNAVGVKTGNVTGNLAIGGTVSVLGQGAQALVVGGNVAGTVKINGTLTQGVSYTADSGATQVLSPDAISTGVATAQISGNVTGGVIVTTASTTNNVTETAGSIQSYGTSPALLIGGTTATTIGGVAGTTGTYSLAVDGAITATGTYSGLNTYGVVLGGKGGTVAMSNGIGVYGTISATTVNADATGILINQGVTNNSIYIEGTIKVAASGVSSGNLYGIRDLSGTLTTVNNTGFITVSGASTGKNAAIDLSSNTSGVTIKQYLNAADATSQKNDKAATGYNVDTATVYAAIAGDIYTGSGNDLLDIGTGKVTGNAYLGAGNNTVKLSDDSKWVGNIDFGNAGTATMTMADNARFTGNLALNGQAGTLTIGGSSIWAGTVTGANQLAVTVNGGQFNANSSGVNTINALTVNSGGSLGVYVDGTTGTASKLMANTVTFASGAKIGVTVTSFAKAAGTYDIVSAGTLTGASNVTTSSLALPVLFKGSITSQGNDIYLTLARKSATELGLTSPQAAAYDAIIANAANFGTLQSSLLQIGTAAGLQTQFNQLLPDYAGGAYDFVSRASRMAALHITEDTSLFTISGSGAWVEPLYFHANKHDNDTVGYTTNGGGLSVGFEKVTAIGNVGLYFDWANGSVDNTNAQKLKVNNLEFNAFWRKKFGNLYAFARGGYGKSSFTLDRNFTGAVNGAAIAYTAHGGWKGKSIGATGGFAYDFNLSDTFKVKPKATFDYLRLKEDGYQETGTDAMILLVNGRRSTALTATTTLGFVWSSGPSSTEGRPFSVEVDAGRRSHLSGDLGMTTATFGSGSTFTLTPQNVQSAWVGTVGILQGGLDYTWKISATAEKPENGGIGYGARASLSIAL